LRLAPEADVWCLPGQGVLLRSHTGLCAFPGLEAEACTVALRDGAHAADKLFGVLAGGRNPLSLIATLTEFRRGGLLVEVDAIDRRQPLAIDEIMGPGLPRAVLTPLTADLSDEAVGPGPWAPVDINVQQITVGPLFAGRRDDPCCNCLMTKTRAHDDLGSLLASVPGARLVQGSSLPHERIAEQCTFVQHALARLQGLPPGTILLRTAEGGESIARASPRAGCLDCLAPTLFHDEPGSAVLRDGGYRPLDAADLLARLVRIVDPITGIVRSVAPPDLPSRGLNHVMIARHAFPLATPDMAGVIRNRRGRSAGKGQTADEARAGAIAEALERFAGVARPDDIVHVACAADLDGSIIAPNDWTLYSQAQLEAAPEWRALGHPAAWVPDASAPDAPMAWTLVSDLATGASGWAPSALCWHQFRVPAGCASPGQGDSNGCAAGQGRTDALVQALLELIERDSVGIWWWSRARRPSIDPESLDNPWLTRTFGMLRGQEFRPVLYDLTHDLGVPVVAAVAWPTGGVGPLLLGFGAHPVGGVAAARAVTEIVQALPARPASEIGGDPRRGFGLVPGCKLHDAAVRDDLGFLIPNDGPGISIPDHGVPPATAAEALQDLITRFASRNMHVWMLDQSRPDVPMPVVRVIVPGLRHFRPRFAPGRLDMVPVALGWRTERQRNRLFIRQ